VPNRDIEGYPARIQTPLG